jgi:hypothetical protein
VGSYEGIETDKSSPQRPLTAEVSLAIECPNVNGFLLVPGCLCAEYNMLCSPFCVCCKGEGARVSSCLNISGEPPVATSDVRLLVNAEAIFMDNG